MYEQSFTNPCYVTGQSTMSKAALLATSVNAHGLAIATKGQCTHRLGGLLAPERKHLRHMLLQRGIGQLIHLANSVFGTLASDRFSSAACRCHSISPGTMAFYGTSPCGRSMQCLCCCICCAHI